MNAMIVFPDSPTTNVSISIHALQRRPQKTFLELELFFLQKFIALSPRQLVPVSIFSGLAAVVPYLTPYALQIGIPFDIMGGGLAAILIATLILKPLASGLADKFPQVRRLLFLALICATAVCYSSIGLIKPFGTNSSFSSIIIYDTSKNLSEVSTNLLEPVNLRHQLQDTGDGVKSPFILVPNNGEIF